MSAALWGFDDLSSYVARDYHARLRDLTRLILL